MFRLVGQKAAVHCPKVVPSLHSKTTLLYGGGTRLLNTIAADIPEGVPTVKDVLIDLTFVDPSGARRKVKGVIGKSFFFGKFRKHDTLQY